MQALGLQRDEGLEELGQKSHEKQSQHMAPKES